MTERHIGAGNSSERYRYVPGHEVELGSIGNLFYSTLSRQHQLLSRTEAKYIAACNRFATLEEHAILICRRFGQGDQDHTAIKETLKKACDQGLLVAEGDFFAGKYYDDATGRIESIAVPTRARPELLCRTINSFAQNNREFDRTTGFFVSDGDCGRQSADRCKALLQELVCREPLSIVYSGHGEKLAYAEELSRASAVPIDVLHFALFGLPECDCTIGANRNAVLLHSAGTLSLNVDDDVLCELTLPPDADRQSFWLASEGEDVSDVWFYSNLSDLRNAITPLRESVLDAHERLLGRAVRSVVTEAAELADVHLDSACPHILKSVKCNTGSIVVTYNGIAGNPGMHNRGALLLTRSRHTRDQLTASEAQYQLGLTSGEMVRSTSHRVISHGGPWTGGSFGLDNRDLVPPFLPVQRGEDGLFGFLLSHCFSDCYFSHIPETVLHAPSYQIRCGDPADAFSRLQLSEIFVGLAVSAPKKRSGHSRAEQMSQLGSYLSEVSSMPDEEFEEFLQSILWSRASSMAAMLDHLLVKYKGEPEFWAADIQRGLQALDRRLRTGEYTIPADLLENRTMVQARKLTKTITAKYGQLLLSWPAIVAAARDLRQQGKEFGTKLT